MKQVRWRRTNTIQCCFYVQSKSELVNREENGDYEELGVKDGKTVEMLRIQTDN